MKFCVLVRMYNDEPYINYFISHYLNLGFNKIVILNSSDNGYINQNPNVRIHKICKTKPWMGNTPKEIINSLKSDYDWVFVVDTDEFLILHKKYKTIQDYIEEKLKINSNINVFQFKWLMIEKIDNEELSFKQIVKNYKSYLNNTIKSLIKTNEVISFKTDHYPLLKSKPIVFIENKCTDVLDATISLELRKFLEYQSFVDSALIHISTRNLDDLILKSLVTNFTIKKIPSIIDLKKIISKPDDLNLENVKKNIGRKFLLPFVHTNNFNNDITILSEEKFNIPDINVEFVNKSYADEILKKVLKENDIDFEEYKIFIDKLGKEINKNFNIKRNS